MSAVYLENKKTSGRKSATTLLILFVPQIAPNFLGTLISKVLLRGSDLSGYEKANTNPLRSVTPLVEKVSGQDGWW